jgi:hypothetical protein
MPGFVFVSHKFQPGGRASRVEHQTKADYNRHGKCKGRKI